ncbi:ComEC/Rec2 family competence protein [Acidicapsa ligni]|uniref:ComEC/Rec2 family competence protein n=1 Tax=Acidicapsa ligni TaxID=542300 RepID=UPI0021DF8E5D|nr:MBL fold metallo-hydrolase [Acidicapsa ligni]
MMNWNRREFLWASAGLAVLPGMTASAEESAAIVSTDTVGAVLEPWQPGFLDIHHINTGRGNSALTIMPDGTSLLIDAGASATQGPAMNVVKPDASKRPGEWIAGYIQRQLTATGRPELDYALLTHLHGDHVGDVRSENPKSAFGDYKRTGISDVAEAIRIRRLIDRGFPDYNYPAAITDPAALNYAAFARSVAKRGTVVERMHVGSASQIELQHAKSRYTEFGVRVLSGDGQVWTGQGEESKLMFPPEVSVGPNPTSMENSCSIALRIGYGKFSYFNGGDLNCDTNYGRDPWRDIETPAGRVSGPVSVSTCNHHGYFDATGPEFVKAVQPRVWILQSWHASHPAISTLANIYSPILYPGPRDVFCLSLNPATELACARFSDSFKSKQGHVVVRVAPGGAEFRVMVLEDADESGRVKAVFGPYPS